MVVFSQGYAAGLLDLPFGGALLSAHGSGSLLSGPGPLIKGEGQLFLSSGKLTLNGDGLVAEFEGFLIAIFRPQRGLSANPGLALLFRSQLVDRKPTDPLLNAWYDRQGEENADKCAWTFGATYTTNGGAVANLALNGRSYLVQRNWVNASGGYCSMSYP